jgi:glycerophosphoryl diester phosphodiesterase
MSRSQTWLDTTPIAHRGYHDSRIPENSLGAFREAISRGMGIELDVKQAGGGELIVFHDSTTTRLTTADLDVQTSSLTELKALRLKGSDERIPTLGEVLALVRGRVPLLIEIKPVVNPHEVCSRVLETLRDYDGDLAVQSFDPRIILWFRRNSPQMLRVQLATRSDSDDVALPWLVRLLLRTMAMNLISRPSAIAYDIRTAPSFALSCWRRAFNCPVLFWTVKTSRDLDRAHRLRGNVIVDFKYFAAAEDLRVPVLSRSSIRKSPQY